MQAEGKSPMQPTTMGQINSALLRSSLVKKLFLIRKLIHRFI